MRLNMAILADRMKELVVEEHLTESLELPLSSARIFVPGSVLSDRYVYIIEGETFPEALPKYFILISEEEEKCARHSIPEDCSWLKVKKTDRLLILNLVQEIFDWFNNWEDELMSARAFKVDIQSIVDCIADAFANPIALMDSTTRCIAWAGKLPEKRDALWDMLLGTSITYASEMVEIYKRKNINPMLETFYGAKIFRIDDPIWPDTMQANIFDRETGIRLGNFGATALNAPLTIGQAALMQYAAEYMSTVLKAYSQSLVDGRKQSFRHLIDGITVNERFFWEQLTGNAGLSHVKIRLVTIASCPGTDEKANLEVLAELLRIRLPENENIILAFEGRIHCFTIGTVGEEALENWIGIVKKALSQYRFCVGISELFETITEVPEYHKQTLAALQYAAGKEQFEVIPFRTCKMKYIRDVLEREFSIKTLCERSIYELWEYDNKHNTPYCRTYAAYLENDRSVTETAGALYLHRNTIIYRLEKMRDLFGEELFELSKSEALLGLQLLMEK